MEEWRAVKGYEGLYEVSNTGKVRSLYRYKKELKPMKARNGYLRVDLFNDKGRKQFSIHRLVATAFIENPGNLPQVNHKDENKENNHVDNLEWCSQQANNTHGTRLRRMVAHTDYSNRVSHPNQIKAVSISIDQFSKDGKYIRTWRSATEFCIANNKTSIAPIRRCCQGERKTAYGYVFRNSERNDDLSVTSCV